MLSRVGLLTTWFVSKYSSEVNSHWTRRDLLIIILSILTTCWPWFSWLPYHSHECSVFLIHNLHIPSHSIAIRSHCESHSSLYFWTIIQNVIHCIPSSFPFSSSLFFGHSPFIASRLSLLLWLRGEMSRQGLFIVTICVSDVVGLWRGDNHPLEQFRISRVALCSSKASCLLMSSDPRESIE